MATWFTADLHLSHERISELAGRPFLSVEEMNADLVQRWVKVVKPEDEVWILGDVCMGALTESLAILAALPGRKILVPGNHDRVASVYRGGTRPQRARWKISYCAAGLLIVQEQVAMEFGGTSFVLCHYPYAGDSQESDRYVAQRPPDHGLWLLHGHIHQKWRVNDRQINVGVDAWGGGPVSLAQVLAEVEMGPGRFEVSLPWV